MTPDAVITRAGTRGRRARRGTRGHRPPDRPVYARASGIVAEERALEDQPSRKSERNADESLQIERAEQVALLSAERTETDKDLSSERARSDAALATRDAFLGIVSHDLRNILSS